jgi:hypothetical protein
MRAAQRGNVMPGSFVRSRFLDELQAFLAFLSGLWGALTGLSVLFPLANVFFDVIPLREHFQPLFRLPSDVVTPLAVVTSLFVLLATYGRRETIAAAPGRDRTRRTAALSFGVGLTALAIYLFGNALIGSRLYGDTGRTSVGGDSKLVTGDLVFICLYCAFFALLTRAFLLLAMLEYFRQRDY